MLVLGGLASLVVARLNDEPTPIATSAESQTASAKAVAEFENTRLRSNLSRLVDSSDSKDIEAKVVYQRTSHSSYNDSPAHIFYVGNDQYEVDAESHKIVQFGPRPLTIDDPEITTTDFGEKCDPKQLQALAFDFAAKHSSLPLEGLEESMSDKDGIAYFFRWETSAKKFDGMRAFIQVGLNCAGDLLSFTNTLDLKEKSSWNTNVLENSSRNISGVYIFANNGNSYAQFGPAQYWWTANNEGYCSTRFADWCNPKNMRYTYENPTESNHAYWYHPQSYVAGTHKVFIPRVNGTTRQASYFIHYGGASTASFGLDQLSYSDVWVQTRTLTSINFTHLSDVPFAFHSPSGKKIAFDEIQIVY